MLIKSIHLVLSACKQAMHAQCWVSKLQYFCLNLLSQRTVFFIYFSAYDTFVFKSDRFLAYSGEIFTTK